MEGILVGRLVFHGVMVGVKEAVRVGPGSGDAVEVTVIVAAVSISVGETVVSPSDAAQLVSAREKIHTMKIAKLVL